MAELVSELIITLDGKARGTRSPGYYGFSGSEFDGWLAAENERPHRMVLGRRTYEMLNDLPEDARDEGWRAMTSTPGWVYSRTLAGLDWPGPQVVRTDVRDHLREARQRGGDEIRTVGSLSLVRQLLGAQLVDRLRLIVCPLILPETGTEPLFAGMHDMQFELLDSKLLDRRVMVLDYRPGGSPPYA